MSLAIKYENVEDARMRLRGTVVLYKGAPVYIRDVARGENKDEILRVLFDPLPLGGKAVVDKFGRRRPAADFIDELADEAKAAERKYISSKHFDIAPFRMGYVNDPKNVFYVTRLPNRVQKQGLCGENFQACDNKGQPVGFQTFLSAKEVPAMVANNYPGFDKALDALAKVPAVAFHRDFCLVKDEVIPNLVFLYHKGVKVGMYARDNAKVSLGNKYGCLKESLEEMRIKVGAF